MIRHALSGFKRKRSSVQNRRAAYPDSSLLLLIIEIFVVGVVLGDLLETIISRMPSSISSPCPVDGFVGTRVSHKGPPGPLDQQESTTSGQCGKTREPRAGSVKLFEERLNLSPQRGVRIEIPPHLADRMEDRAVIAAAEIAPDIDERQLGQLAGKVDADLAREDDARDPRLGPEAVDRDVEVLGDGLLNGLNGDLFRSGAPSPCRPGRRAPCPR